VKTYSGGINTGIICFISLLSDISLSRKIQNRHILCNEDYQALWVQ